MCAQNGTTYRGWFPRFDACCAESRSAALLAVDIRMPCSRSICYRWLYATLHQDALFCILCADALAAEIYHARPLIWAFCLISTPVIYLALIRAVPLLDTSTPCRCCTLWYPSGGTVVPCGGTTGTWPGVCLSSMISRRCAPSEKQRQSATALAPQALSETCLALSPSAPCSAPGTRPWYSTYSALSPGQNGRPGRSASGWDGTATPGITRVTALYPESAERRNCCPVRRCLLAVER
jgi:hypothetical protein